MSSLPTPDSLRASVPDDADRSYIVADLRSLAVPISSLLPDPRNARKHPEKNLDAVKASLRSFKQRKPVVVNSRTLIVEAGNGTIEAAKSLGWQYVAAVFQDDDAVTATGYGLADNRSAELAEWDTDVLTDLIKDLKTDGVDVSDLGWSGEDLLAMLPDDSGGEDGGGGDDPAPIDKAAELQKVWKTARGQVWEIPSKSVPGRCHRVMCGDCRDASDVAMLLDGQKVNVAFTSPPYASQRKYDEESGFKPIKPDAYVEWFEAVQENVRLHLAPDGSWFVNIKEHCEDGQRHLYVKDLTIAHVRRWGWRFVDELVWKRHGLPGGWKNRFKNCWEPIMHFSLSEIIKCDPSAVEVAPAESTRSDKRRSTYDQKPHEKASTGSGFADGAFMSYSGAVLPGNVIECDAIENGIGHSAAFPVALPTFFIKAYSDPGDVIFDPFLGSGTTLIAAEREGRIGHGMELSPKYLAVILERAKNAGLEPRLLE